MVGYVERCEVLFYEDSSLEVGFTGYQLGFIHHEDVLFYAEEFEELYLGFAGGG